MKHMRHGMNAWVAMAVGIAGVAVAQSAEAVGPSSDITITVTIQRLAVEVDAGAVAFGTVALGSQTVSSEPKTVTNRGNVTETYTLQLTSVEPEITIGETETAAGADTFVLQALFGSSATPPSSADFGADAPNDDDVIKGTVARAASDTAYAVAGGATGASVNPNDSRFLSFKYSAPTSDTLTGGIQEQIKVQVTATAS